MENFVRFYTDELEELERAAGFIAAMNQANRTLLDCAAYNVLVDAIQYIKGRKIAAPSFYAQQFFTLSPEVREYETNKHHTGADGIEFPHGWETTVDQVTR